VRGAECPLRGNCNGFAQGDAALRVANCGEGAGVGREQAMVSKEWEPLTG
jgi:hypothetical protein